MRRFINDKSDYFYYIAWVYLMGLFIFSLLGDRGLLTSFSLWSEKQTLQTHIEQLDVEIQKTKIDIDNFRHNPRAIYQHLREHFNVHEKNETVFVFKKKS